LIGPKWLRIGTAIVEAISASLWGDLDMLVRFRRLKDVEEAARSERCPHATAEEALPNVRLPATSDHECAIKFYLSRTTTVTDCAGTNTSLATVVIIGRDEVIAPDIACGKAEFTTPDSARPDIQYDTRNDIFVPCQRPEHYSATCSDFLHTLFPRGREAVPYTAI
jgi:hypothetical protein